MARDVRRGAGPARLLLLAALLGVLAAPGLAAPAEPSAAPPVPLVGRLGIAMVDDPFSLLPDEGDPRWKEVALGPEGLDRPLPHREGVAWVRLAFTLQSGDAFRRPGLLLLRPADADEVVLNGVPFGGTGVIAPRFVAIPTTPRLVAVPPGLLHGGENELAMKVLLAGKSARVLDAPLLLGEIGALEARQHTFLHLALAAEAAFLAVIFFLPVLYGFLLLRGITRGEYIFFALFTFVYGVAFFLGSHIFMMLGAPSVLTTHAGAVLSSLLVTVMIALVTSATGGRFGGVFWALLLAAGLFVLLDIFLAPLTGLVALATARKLFLTLVGLYYLYMAGRAVLARRPEAWIIFGGVAAYLAGSRIELFWGLNLRDTAMGVFALAMLFALATRHARLKDRLAAVSGKLLDAHEEERRRIARDLHDSVGQALLAQRLDLQLLASRARAGSPAPAGSLEDAAQRTLGIIEEVRRAALDLRPSHVEAVCLADALRWYGGNIADPHGVEIVFHEPADPVPEPPARVKDNLYRIFQEALHNAAKHSRAGRIDVSLYCSGSRLVLQVADNGQGFDPGAGKGEGIGLHTMRERAELLGGECRLESRKGKGTIVTVEVPSP
jgi:signal transduction histidine kinase